MILTLFRPGKSTLPYMQYRLTDALITSVRHVRNGAAQPTEQVSFAFGRIGLRYETVAGEQVETDFNTSP